MWTAREKKVSDVECGGAEGWRGLPRTAGKRGEGVHLMTYAESTAGGGGGEGTTAIFFTTLMLGGDARSRGTKRDQFPYNFRPTRLLQKKLNGYYKEDL